MYSFSTDLAAPRSHERLFCFPAAPCGFLHFLRNCVIIKRKPDERGVFLKLFAPKYYKDFVCIADRCRHTCCVGWEIDLDADAMERYSRTDGYGKAVLESVVLPTSAEESPHFRLDAEERCPHLTEKGLCRIITELGEGFLCHICREHPRFYNETVRGKEVGLGMACEEACRLILSSDDYGCMEEIGDSADGFEESEAGMFNVLPLRDKVFDILSDRTVPYEERLGRIYGEFGVTPQLLSDEEWRGILSGLEYLEEGHRAFFSVYTSHASSNKDRLMERALAYFVYRHCAEALDEEDFLASLGFCLFCERLLASVTENAADEDMFADAARILSEELEYSEDNTEAIRLAFFTNL